MDRCRGKKGRYIKRTAQRQWEGAAALAAAALAERKGYHEIARSAYMPHDHP